MVNYCSVPGCTEKGGHSFPKDAAMRLKWKVAIRRIDPKTKQLWEPGNCAVVCRHHFTKDSYVETLMGE